MKFKLKYSNLLKKSYNNTSLRKNYSLRTDKQTKIHSINNIVNNNGSNDEISRIASSNSLPELVHRSNNLNYNMRNSSNYSNNNNSGDIPF